jgi:glyceraldehyde-3-phosphate dehydrogenase (NAD(P))
MSSKRTKIGIVGFGTIGQRLADGVTLQDDMELVGVVNRSASLKVRALCEAGMPYDLYLADLAVKPQFDELGIPVVGGIDELLEQVDVVLDATPAGVGRANKALYEHYGCKAIFQGGEKTDLAEVFFHGYANYEEGLGRDFLKITSCNTTGLIRAVDALHRSIGVERVAITIIRRAADPGETQKGIVDLLQIEPVPNHQATDLMYIMPQVQATGLSVHAPITHGHVINVVARVHHATSKDEILNVFDRHPRIRLVRIADGFNSNTSLFNYYRDLGRKRGDMYEIAVWEESINASGSDITFAINIPQETVTIPETLDGVRACMRMQHDRLDALYATNRYLGLEPQVSMRSAQVAPV